MEIPRDVPLPFVLVFNTMLPALGAILFGLLFSWASKRKVTRAAAAVRSARRVGGMLAAALQK